MIDRITQQHDRHIAKLITQANIPGSRVARQLERYKAAANVDLPPTLKTFFIDLGSSFTSVGFQIRHGIHPDAVIEAQEKATTPPEKG